MSIEGQGHFFTIYFPGFVCFVFFWPINQVSVYRIIGFLVFSLVAEFGKELSTRLTVCSPLRMSIWNFSYIPFLFLRAGVVFLLLQCLDIVLSLFS